MAITWTIDITPNRSKHSVTFIFKEMDGTLVETYSITVPYEQDIPAMLAKVKKDFKTEVLKRRAIRQKVAAIKAAINVDQIEAFLNS